MTPMNNLARCGFILAMALLLSACSGSVVKPSAFQRANGHLDEGRPLAAVAEYKTALAERPDDFKLHYNVGNAYHDAFLAAKERGESEAAETYRAEAERSYRYVHEQLDPGNARSATGLALLSRDAGNEAEAIRILESTLEQKPAEAFVPLWTLGVIRRDSGDRAGAIQAFEEAQLLNPEHLPSAVALADLLSRSNSPQDVERLVAIFDRASELHPFDFTLRRQEALLRLAIAEKGNDKAAWRSAKTALLRAQALSEEDWRVANGLAHIREREQEYREAIFQLWRAQDGVAAERNAQTEADRRSELNEQYREMQGRLLKLYDKLRQSESQSTDLRSS